MAVVNSVCIDISNCNLITINDTSDWDTIDPNVDIISTEVNIESDGVVYTISDASYLSEIQITPELINQTDTINDAIYKITVSYTHSDTTVYTIFNYVLQNCSIECKISQLALEIASENCGDCASNKASTLYELIAKNHALCASIACNNISAATNILEWLTNSLINFNCNNC